MTVPPHHASAAGGGIEVVEVEGTPAPWDEFVRQTPEGTFCHLVRWRRIMTEVLGHECRYLVAADDAGRWHGVLPLVRVRSRLFGHYLLSMPFLNYGGPIGSQAAQRRLIEHAIAETRGSGADLLELRSRTPVPGALATSDRKITVVLELPPSAETLWSERFPSKLRSQIRRPQKEGMEVRLGLEHVGPFYEVFCRNMRELGTPVLPRSFFDRVRHEFVDTVEFAAVYLAGRPVAAGCGFRWRDEFELTWASSLREHNRKAPNMLLYWGLMEEMISRGVRRFNFGRCSPGGGTHRFKRQWGGADVQLPWAQWSPTGVTATPSPERPLYRSATAVWRRLPLRLTNRVGPLLARHLP